VVSGSKEFINMCRVYEYISRHFLASISDDVIYKKVTVTITMGNGYSKEGFKLIGTKLIDEGYIEVMPWVKFTNTRIPDLIKKTLFKPISMNLSKRKVSINNYSDYHSWIPHRIQSYCSNGEEWNWY
jgi:DNA topoisomerase IA